MIQTCLKQSLETRLCKITWKCTILWDTKSLKRCNISHVNYHFYYILLNLCSYKIFCLKWPLQKYPKFFYTGCESPWMDNFWSRTPREQLDFSFLFTLILVLLISLLISSSSLSWPRFQKIWCCINSDWTRHWKVTFSPATTVWFANGVITIDECWWCVASVKTRQNTHAEREKERVSLVEPITGINHHRNHRHRHRHLKQHSNAPVEWWRLVADYFHPRSVHWHETIGC